MTEKALKRGTVVKWKHTYGFIEPEDGGEHAYFHYTAIASRRKFRSVMLGQRVMYEPGIGDNGRPCAPFVQVC